mgnify:CR=1 FL=1
MKNILCFGDSNTFGFDPENKGLTDMRFEREERWTGILQAGLGENCYGLEEGLGGRTTSFEEPITPGRKGADFLLPCIHSHQPLDLVILMLGTNDVKTIFPATAEDIGRGMGKLVEIALNPFATYARKVPQVLIVAPPPVGAAIEKSPTMAGSFDLGSRERSLALAGEYQKQAEAYGCHFMDGGAVTAFNERECVHLDIRGHRKLGTALIQRVKEILLP